jgi:uncharacterized membrane protein
MDIPDLPTIIVNISHSFVDVIYMLKGVAYLVGVTFVYISITRFRKIAERHAQYPSQEKSFVPITYLVIGAGLIMLPESISILSTTAFGNANVLAYTKPRNPNNLFDAMAIFIKMAGFIWVIRGAVLLATATQPGVQEGSKGAAFLVGGLCALNLESSLAVINTIITKIQTMFGAHPP